MITRLGSSTKSRSPIGNDNYRVVTKNDFNNAYVYRALSLLHHVETRDGTPAVLPVEQAKDVLRWAKEYIA